MTIPADPTLSAELRERLAALEAELRVLRRELAAPAERPDALPDGAFEVLRCSVGGTFYGIPIDRVREIVRYIQVTPVADVPEAVAGAIDVRGEILAVVDARCRFGKPVTPPRRGTAIVLVRTADRSVGLVVDEVLDVLGVTRDLLTTPGGMFARAEAIVAIATLDAEIVQIVDLERVLDAVQWQRIDAAIESIPPSGLTRGSGEGELDGGW